MNAKTKLELQLSNSFRCIIACAWWRSVCVCGGGERTYFAQAREVSLGAGKKAVPPLTVELHDATAVRTKAGMYITAMRPRPLVKEPRYQSL